ncbi:oligosaccharyl transferase, archaeosortase A system-associated [Methanomicrobium antiquum]|uniref:dolichyl-phosphooligosaccharide-protein glycotransferase n=1 Tax=Methanomicrobium antiquum TaxID=487686 RepID=A0AAF0FUL6_9EURY|nr:oligosaccharyl transferase, archaeosortase A system-associated [Methanomicrobium antiquum]WFN36803.1 oligosaccharyl transferase, archaeosortase A system-associated [Methanomicrobium antiquum]
MSHLLKNNIHILILLLFFAVLSFIIRVLPVFFLPDTGFIHIIRGDAEFNLRQIEIMVHNFPQYNWFDPMTAYPTGKEIGWGPLFPMIASFFAIITGASTTSEIINASSYVPPLMAALMVVVVFFIAYKVTDDKLTGVISAGVSSVISLFFLNYTSWGYVDHHAGEILFSALFCLSYIIASGKAEDKFTIDKTDPVFTKTAVFAILAGFFYAACYFTSPTTVLFLVIISLFTFVSCILSHNREVLPVREGFINTVTLIIPAVLILLFGVKYSGFSLSNYTIIHVIIPVLIIFATWFLVFLSYALSKTNYSEKKLLYPAAVLIAGLFVSLISAVIIPDIFSNLFMGADLIFGLGNYSIAEMQAWNFDYAVQSYHFAFILAFFGAIVAGKKVIEKGDKGLLFILLWAAITLYITIRHLRFEFFIAVPFSVLCAVCIAYAYENYYTHLLAYLKEDKKQTGTKKDKKKAVKKEPLKAGLFLAVMLIAVLFFANSVISDVSFAADYSEINFEEDKWISAMEWMDENTPDTGVSYFGEYKKESFEYPKESYGVMSWWDFGHVITLIGKRIPISNPFQDNVFGSRGCADFFISGTESEGNIILDNSGAKYVVTNSELTTPESGILPILTWLNKIDTAGNYLIHAGLPSESGEVTDTIAYTPEYYNTMIVRLNILDGSYVKPEMVGVLTTKTVSGVTTISGYEVTDYDSAVLMAEDENKYLISTDTDNPCTSVSALKNYRLVYETEDLADNVKIFEYVKGYEISGEGTVELEIETNTGRKFTYVQESENGQFVLPYSTIDNPYGVLAVGKYHIINTDDYFDVSEKDLYS